MTYAETLQKINDLEPRGWRLGLDRMQAFCDHAGLTDTLTSTHFIHIAGTNGKGSTTAFVESLLRSGGIHTGAFFSPFVQSYRERIQLNGQLISKGDLILYAARLFETADTFEDSEFGGITKFEFEAALGFLYWREKRCDWVALEVGLGGRLDATNVVHPRCSVIVSIGLDHTAILGNTLGEIAGEKAGIIKPGIPVMVGEMPPEALRVIEAKASELESPIWRFGQEIQLQSLNDGFKIRTPVGEHGGLRPGLEGQMQAHNLALAVAAIDAVGLGISEDELREGAGNAKAPARFQRVERDGVQYLVDGAHNAEAAQALAVTLRKEFSGRQPWVLVANGLAGHDLGGFFEPLARLFSGVFVAPIDSPRALDLESAVKIAQGHFERVEISGSVEEALRGAGLLAGQGGLVVVTGSNYLAGEALNSLEG